MVLLNVTLIFNFYACLDVRPRRQYFHSWPIERRCGIIETTEEKPHADSLLFSLRNNSWGYSSIS